MNLSHEHFSFGRSLTIGTLLALAAGVVAGTLAPPADQGLLPVLSRVVETLGAAWVRALRMTVMPVVVALLVVAILGSRDHMGVARMGSAAVGIFFAIYVALALLSALLFPPLIRAFGIARGAIASLRVDTGGVPPMEVPSELDAADWLLQVIPANPLGAAAEDNILQVVVFTILFAVAVGRLSPDSRKVVLSFFAPIAEAMLVILAWLMRVSPVAVFALAFAAARDIGFGAAWILVSFAIMTSVIMVLAVLGLAPVAGILGRVGTARFAHAAWPGQLLAVTTRSSIATVPALVEGAKNRLGLSDRVVGFGIPFSASTFKPNRLVSSPGKLLFLAWIYGVSVDPLSYAMFIGYVILLAATTVGVPNQGSRHATLPAYLALGIPVEGVAILIAVDVIPDLFKTLLNLTSYASTALLVAKNEPAAEVAATEPA